jgi:hypothetical protein
VPARPFLMQIRFMFVEWFRTGSMANENLRCGLPLFIRSFYERVKAILALLACYTVTSVT